MYLLKEEKRTLKEKMRLPKTPYKSRNRYLVSVWLPDEGEWMEDMRFKYFEDAQVHAARWCRIYGVTMTQITTVEI
jgi:hypothetical protein